MPTACATDVLTVAKHEYYPQEWAQAEIALATNRHEIKDVSGASLILRDVLTKEPDQEEAFYFLSGIYHDELFDFASANMLNEGWLARHKDSIPVQTNLAESQFTLGRFVECQQMINTLLMKRAVPVESKLALRAIEIASLLALGQKKSVRVKMQMLIDEVDEASKQSEDFKVRWTFNGTEHFINQNKKFVPYRAWLQRFLDVFKVAGRESLVKALREVQVAFK